MIPTEFRPGLIVCEGHSDSQFFAHLLRSRGIGGWATAFPENPHPGGKGGFSSLLRALRVSSGFLDAVSKVLVVGDNDLTPDANFAELQASIREAEEYGVPARPLQWMKGHGMPETAIMMIPATGVSGDLELLLMESASDKWPEIKRCLDAYVACTGVGAWDLTKRSKMMMRSLIAAVCMTDPNTSLVHLWRRAEEYRIPLDHPSLDHIVEFLRASGG